MTKLVLKAQNTDRLVQILDTKIIAHCGVFVDYECGEFVLMEASNDHYFNQSFNWLIYDHNNIGVDKIFDGIPNVGINADITVIQNKLNESSYELFDVYSQGRHLGLPLISTKYACWNLENGLKILHTFPPKNHKDYRGNFMGTLLRGVTVIDRENIFSKDVENLLTPPGFSIGITPFIKYFYSFNMILKDMYNFTIEYRVARGWAGRLKSGYRLGLLGIVQRGEADIVGSGAFTRINRHDDFDFIHYSWKFEAGFFYRITPDIMSTGEIGNFLMPFTKMVWVAILIFAISIAVIMFISSLWKRKLKLSLVFAMLHTIGALCQQGIEPIPNFRPTRIILLTLMLTSLLLYNFYTSSVVGALLSSIPKGPATINEIVESPLILSFEDIGYHRILFRESNKTIIKEMIREKIEPTRPDKLTIPVYTTLAKALPFIRKGGYAFHSETASAYPVIAKEFDAKEICDLRIVPGLLETDILGLIQPKRNMYSEIFKIGMMRAQECGLVDRSLKRFQPKKPVCQSGSTIVPVSFNSITSAFLLLGLSIALSLLILLIEILHYKWKKK